MINEYTDTSIGTLPLSTVVGYFIIAIGSFVSANNPDFIQELILVCNMIIKCAEEHSDDYIGKRKDKGGDMEEKSSQMQDKNISYVQSGPKLSNKLVVELFPNYFKKLKK